MTTPFLFFLGADDLVVPGALERLADALEAEPGADIAWGDYEFFGDRTDTVRLPPWDPWRLTYYCYWPGVCMVRTPVIPAIGGARAVSRYEDWDMWLALAEQGRRGIVVPGLAFRYRITRAALRRSADAGNDMPREYRVLRDGHRELWARRRELRRQSPLSAAGKLREWVQLQVQLRAPAPVRKGLYRLRAALIARAQRRAAAGAA